MRAEITLIRRSAAGLERKAESERLRLDSIDHVPRIGYKLSCGGRDYRVVGVVWDFAGNSVTTGAES